MAGSAMQSSGDPAGIKTGNSVVIGGLAFQLGAFVIFIIMTAVFMKRLAREPTVTAQRPHVRWTRQLYNLLFVSALVTLRSAFRLAEFVEGNEGRLYKTEALLYVFDAAIMFIVVVAMFVSHPGLMFRAVRKAEIVALEPGSGVEEDNRAFLLRDQQKREMEMNRPGRIE